MKLPLVGVLLPTNSGIKVDIKAYILTILYLTKGVGYLHIIIIGKLWYNFRDCNISFSAFGRGIMVIKLQSESKPIVNDVKILLIYLFIFNFVWIFRELWLVQYIEPLSEVTSTFLNATIKILI